MALKLPKLPKMKRPKLPTVKRPKLSQVKAPKMPSLGIGAGLSSFFDKNGFQLLMGTVGYLPAIAFSIYILTTVKSDLSKNVSIAVIVLGIIGILLGMTSMTAQVHLGIFVVVYILVFTAYMTNSAPPAKEEEKKKE
jgi:uncharacterized membrane protein YphA (DoxX/SURF4 family)